ncbi:50S ribosomal protein L24 [Candidatus Berkelbacteria bacterium]|nr:50S ribosomal protein L24 [Candidatus Berkelbacteria bacterium]
MKFKIKKNDLVWMAKGKDKGKTGRVIRFLPAEKGQSKALVLGLNLVKKHQKPSPRYPRGGIISKETLVFAANLRLFCQSCQKPTKVIFKEKERYCQKCKARIETPLDREGVKNVKK